MQLDQTHIQIRVRPHLEVLDLAVVVCRQHWWRLGLWLLAGVGPVLLLNLALTPTLQDSVYLYTALVILEIPWATAFLTLYLGQATFLSAISPRKIVRDFFASFPQLFVYQGLLRAVCAIFWPAWFYIVLRMRFLNEIILLERDVMSRTSKRNSQFHGDFTGRLFSEFLADLLIGSFLVIALTVALTSFTDMLLDRQDAGWIADLQYDDYERHPLLVALFSWQGQLSLWLVLSFLSVARFLSYLDCRIRREGWDVELKLRSQGARMAEEMALR